MVEALDMSLVLRGYQLVGGMPLTTSYRHQPLYRVSNGHEETDIFLSVAGDRHISRCPNGELTLVNRENCV
jgi:hypothetical protein